MSNEPESFIPENLKPLNQPPSSPERSGISFDWWRVALISAIGLLLVLFLWPRDPFRSHYTGQGWDYHFHDVELTAPLSAEMISYQDERFRDLLKTAGGDGWELASALPSPRRSAEKGFVYRLLFKRPGKLNPPREPGVNEPRYDSERAARAIKAESEAEAEVFKTKLKAIQEGR